MNNLIEVIQSIDPRFVIGWALAWFGIGVMTYAIRQGFKEARAKARIMHDLFGEGGVGHVVDYHKVFNNDDPQKWYNHAHCICGETSLMYLKSDPTATNLMEQWAEEHINKLMESIGR